MGNNVMYRLVDYEYSNDCTSRNTVFSTPMQLSILLQQGKEHLTGSRHGHRKFTLFHSCNNTYIRENYANIEY